MSCGIKINVFSYYAGHWLDVSLGYVQSVRQQSEKVLDAVRKKKDRMCLIGLRKLNGITCIECLP